MIAVAACGTGGCATYSPWDLPDPYSSGSATSPYYSGGGYGGGGYGYGSYYRGGYYYGDPYYYDPYYRGRVALPYPVYGYPFYPGHSCRDRNHDGRCDGGKGGKGDGDAGNGGQPRPESDRPLKDVRRLFDREHERGARAPGAAPNTALRSVPPAVERGSGKAPKAGAPPRMQTPPSPPRRVESRRSVEASAPARRATRDDGAPRGPRAPRDDVSGRPLR
jgi:hypothetical protein